MAGCQVGLDLVNASFTLSRIVNPGFPLSFTHIHRLLLPIFNFVCSIKNEKYKVV